MKKNDIQLSFQDLTQYANQFDLDLQKDLAVTFTPHAMYTQSGAYELDPSIYETFKKCVDYTLEYYNSSKTKFPAGYINVIDMSMRSVSLDVIWSMLWSPFINSLYSASYTWAMNIFNYMIEYLDDHKVDEFKIRNVPAAFDVHNVMHRENFFDYKYNERSMVFGFLINTKDPNMFITALYEKFAPYIEMEVFNLMLTNYNSMRAVLSDITNDIADVDNPDAVSSFISVIDESFNNLMRNAVTETAIFIKNIEGMADSLMSGNSINAFQKD